MTTLTDISYRAEQLPARVIHALGMDILSAERQQDMTRDILDLVDMRLQNEIWSGVAGHDEALAALHAAYEQDPELDLLDALQMAVELQPDILDSFSQALNDLYSSLTQSSSI